VGLWLL